MVGNWLLGEVLITVLYGLLVSLLGRAATNHMRIYMAIKGFPISLGDD